MYLSSDSDYLSRAIIETVSTHQGMRFSTLKKRLEVQFGIKASKATIYRRISDLVDRNIIIRHGAELLPNLVWVTSIRQLADRLASKNIGYDAGILDLPTELGQSVSYRASSMAKLDPIWNHIHLEIAYRFNENEWYGYNEHPWYNLGMSDSERQLQQTLVEDGQHYHLVYGNNSYLDRRGQEELCTANFHTALAAPGEIPTQLQAFWAASSFVIEVSFSANINQKFDEVFRTVTKISQLDRNAYQDIFREKGDCVLKVERNLEKVAFYRSLVMPKFTQEDSAGLAAA
ncbi:MAG: hypothetical protein KDD62_00110 [Bdellovibrionales bacterium]|nr:hypothetical protein [Bdellovibrionales bacterium]